jgi:RuvB-like protein 1 (pontin 52)
MKYIYSRASTVDHIPFSHLYTIHYTTMTESIQQPAVTPASSSGPTILTQQPPPTTQRESRIATHSHIKGLGLADDGSAMELSQGFVGQVQAREALGLHLSLLKMGRHSGRPLLLVGPPGTGKVS